MQWRHLLSTVTMMFAVLLVGILQGLERPGSVYSIMRQWWLLMDLEYVAAIFHLPSVSNANLNRCNTQNDNSYVKHQQSQPLWYPRCCFLSPTSRQHLPTTTANYPLMSLQACQHTANIMSHNVQFYSVRPLAADPSHSYTKCPTANIQHHIYCSWYLATKWW